MLLALLIKERKQEGGVLFLLSPGEPCEVPRALDLSTKGFVFAVFYCVRPRSKIIPGIIILRWLCPSLSNQARTHKGGGVHGSPRIHAQSSLSTLQSITSSPSEAVVNAGAVKTGVGVDPAPALLALALGAWCDTVHLPLNHRNSLSADTHSEGKKRPAV